MLAWDDELKERCRPIPIDNPMSFEENESFKHKFAKELLRKWLYEEYVGPKWGGDGIYLEYPIVPSAKLSWSNCLIAYNYSFGDNRYEYYGNTSIDYHPSYDQCIAFGDIPIAVLDVAETYKGIIKRGFEVYHTHMVDSVKLDKLKGLVNGTDFKLYEISAEDILRQTKKPADILKFCRRLI
jgi:hypothetical protein